ncbi:hypothetical protein PMSM_12455 [Paenibacillus macquariensis subsp. macquariensis]|uniref:UPF0291 protein SAMN05421578_104129 n=2 Tax=Paenibacillus macquariensis TaxID=948756 RepID=A0ABY1JUR4_9BACL|nr:DUF896 domain-containing protein [Paenibacillus macquariensis]MEC0090928.1 DUF896 domain-containing protein [Paenibacillus macquariensis]OAB34785.1 hypothetical protein PMSM_12455 [Paenibacillus macquariensis subsp. macquariensis]SIQ80510.1 protein of unknown function [Paenibacillus macquariensis]
MDIDNVILRINELAQKKKTVGLNEDEMQERARLREHYLQNIRNNFKQQLDSIEFTDELSSSDQDSNK